jgi:hypothetical protein
VKLKLNVRDAILDADVALEVLSLIEGKAEFIERKWGRGSDNSQYYAFVEDISDAEVSVKPISQKIYAQAVLAEND